MASIVPMGSPSIVALAITPARSSLGSASALFDDLLEVREEVEQGVEECLVVLPPPELGVRRPEQLLGELEHPREVLFWQTEEGEDHVQRVVDGDVGHKITPGAELGHPIDEALRRARRRGR